MKLWIPFILGCCLLGSAAPAAAQFTAVVVPPRQQTRKGIPAIAHADTVQRAQTAAAVKTLSSMKTWVDSAATVLAQQPPTPAETTTVAAAGAPQPGEKRAKGQPDTSGARVSVATGEVGRFHNGARAPATATPLPMLALLGVGSLIAGALLRRRRS